jgi:hypothetical protein
VEVNRQGKLGLEPKDKMKLRGMASPDRADAVLGAISCGGGVGGSWEKYEALSRPTLEELYRDADVMAQNSATPEGMFTGY